MPEAGETRPQPAPGAGPGAEADPGPEVLPQPGPQRGHGPEREPGLGARGRTADAAGPGAIATNRDIQNSELREDIEANRHGEADAAGGGPVLVVAGTHGNERNAVWLLERWRRNPGLLNSAGIDLVMTLGNPAAVAANRRYLERDLNRSFQPALLNDPGNQEQEVRRALELLAQWGPAGSQPCPVVFDLHSTTAAMGNSLVVYGRRPADLALAAGLQDRLGLPVYVHEKDPHQCGYLVEQWPCGLVIEVGPVPQGVVTARICRQTQLALETALALLAEARWGPLRLPQQLVVHRHLRSLDVPRAANGEACALIHPLRHDRDWQPLRPGDPLFLSDSGDTIPWEPQPGDPPTVWPVFINEAAYEEKGIALSLTQREQWPASLTWSRELERKAKGLRGSLNAKHNNTKHNNAKRKAVDCQ